jgi:hypothetical protein
LTLLTLLPAWGELRAQARAEALPVGERLPVFLAGPREAVASASLLGVSRNPNRLGTGVEAEVSLGHSLPVLRLNGITAAGHVLVGIEAAVYARFGLQIVEREMVGTDWLFAVPALWVSERGWVRLRYYHSSSHIGDEYSRRFDEPGVDFSRDALDLFLFSQLFEVLGLYAGVRFGYNVKPEDSRRWVLRGGLQGEGRERGQTLRPYLAGDIEWDQDAGDPRLELKMGMWLPERAGRRRVRLSLGLLAGPSPLGQFQRGRTLQLSLGVAGQL